MTETKVADLFLDMAGDPELKAKFLADPKGVFAARGIEVPAGVTFKVLEDTATVRHIVLPHMLAGEGAGSEELEGRISKSVGLVVP